MSTKQTLAEAKGRKPDPMRKLPQDSLSQGEQTNE